MLHSAGLFAASVGASAVVTAGYSWVSVAAGWLLGGAIAWGVGKLPEKQIGIFHMPMALAAVTFGAWLGENAFPQESTFPFISVCLLMLLYYSLRRSGSVDVGRILGKLLLVVIAFLLAVSLKDISWTLPAMPTWRQILVAAAITIPWWRRMNFKWYGLAGAAVTGISALCGGILGNGLAASVEAPFYRAVQTIHISGILQRFEALMSGAVMVGAFAVMLYGGGLMKKEASWKQNTVLLTALAIEAGIFLLS